MTANPTLLAMPLAQNGQKNVIPETQATAGDGLFSQSTGFPAETSLPLGAGGVAPGREDFNGAFNLLGGVAFYAQKGFTFNYDATQDYYTGCVVIDPHDGLRYECIADMLAGTVAPHSDTANDYWKVYTSGLSRELIPAFNKRDVITTSGTYTAPVTGWYRITVKGAGGGGQGGWSPTSYGWGGAGGGEGGTTIAFEKMTAGQTASVVVGAGGAGGAGGYGFGANGGNTTVTVNTNTYTGGGGHGGGRNVNAGDTYSQGGTGTIPGAPGATEYGVYNSSAAGSNGGGAGGGVGNLNSSPNSAISGGGGAGGWGAQNGAYSAGGDGGDGYAEFSYFDPSLN